MTDVRRATVKPYKHDSSRRRFLESTAAVSAGAASLVLAGSGQSASAQPIPYTQPHLSDAERAKLGWQGYDVPPEALNGPWRNIRAVVEKQVIDTHCHPYETRYQGADSATEQAQHAENDWVDFSDQMIASMDFFGIGFAVCNPAFETFEKQVSTSFKDHPDRLWLSCGLPTEETKRRGGLSKMTPEEVADILRKQIKQDGCVMIGETAGGSIRTWPAKEIKPIADVAMEFEMPIQVHTGWGQTGITSLATGRPYTTASDWAKELATYMQAYPKVTWVIGHEGGQIPIPDGWEAVRLFYSFDNAIAEVSKVQPEIIAACVRGRGAERVIWGSDWNRPKPKNYGPYIYRPSFQHWWNLNNVALADITEDERDWVLYKSARKLLRLPAKPTHKY
jgi:predicted TIM-barrel fold metal-dependent hydrolase